jgi:putative ABC transport system permease protein
MAEEMGLHIEARVTDLIRGGTPAREAERQARIEFGAMEHYKEEGRKARGLNWVDRCRSDLRFVFRSLRKSPMFTAVAVLTLAVGIGANTVVFSTIDGVLLRPLAYSDPDRIYTVRVFVPKYAHIYPDLPVNGRHFDEWRKVCRSCESMALLAIAAFNLGGAGEPQRVEAVGATSEIFPMLGVKMQVGRSFTSSEDVPGANRVIVISDALWRRSFGADRGVIGRKITLDQTPVEIIGVLPPDFRFPRGDQMGALFFLPDRVDVFRPLGRDLSKVRPGGQFNYGALVKLRSGAGPEHAVTEMNRPLAEFAKEANQEMQVRLLPLKAKITGAVRGPLWLLLGAAIALLLIACVNLGNLMMARAAGRHREWAVRSALGARRADLFRQALAESLMLALIGGALGTGLAAAGVKLLSQLAPSTLPRLDEVTLAWSVLVFALLVSATAGALCSLAPVWRMVRADPQEALCAGSPRSTETRVERRIRDALVSFESGLSMALAAAAGLLIVSFVRVLAVDKGFDSDRVLTFQLSLPEGRYTVERRNQFHTDLLERLNTTPGIVSASLTTHLPLQGEAWVSQLQRKGDSRDFNESPQANYRFIGPGYFRSIGVPVQSGRGFEPTDRERKVAVLSERAAQMVFPNENPIGQGIQYSDEREPTVLEIIGVVADVKTSSLESEAPLMVYLPFWRLAPAGVSYVVRGVGDEGQMIATVRSVVSTLDRELPIHRVRTMAQIVDTAVAARRLQTLLAAGFAGAGVLLACLGVFGVVTYGVSRRTNEIGIRMALGASRSEVVVMVVRESMGPVVIGLIAGLAGALALGRFLASQLFGVGPHDPTVLAVIAALVCCAALMASYWPARRAAQIEPIQALRWE